jgi:malate dehydrogenase (oxaloacetate-decarboxylating)
MNCANIRSLVRVFNGRGKKISVPRGDVLTSYAARTASPVSVAIRSLRDLNVVYTPGIGEVTQAILKDPARVYDLTKVKRHIAIITDATATLGFGRTGPDAANPVIVGKARILREFGGLHGVTLGLATEDVNEIITTIRAIAPNFGGIMLEDISAPRCITIENLLQDLGIPVIHDDQHGTAGVILAALINALKAVNKKIEDATVLLAGVGAAGYATIRALHEAGVGNIIAVDKYSLNGHPTNDDILHRNLVGQPQVPSHHATLIEELKRLNVGQISGTLEDAFRRGRPDIFVGLARGGIVKPEWIGHMADRPAVFALSNPVPEVDPVAAMRAGAYIVGTGRADFNKLDYPDLAGNSKPNFFQVNNALLFWAYYRGLVEVAATRFDKRIVVDAATALASLAKIEEGVILPPLFYLDGRYNSSLFHPLVKTVMEAAIRYGAASKPDVVFDQSATDDLLVRRAISALGSDVPPSVEIAENFRKLVSGREKIIFTHSPSVSSDKYSRLVIYLKDRPGLLHQITKLISDCGLNIVNHLSLNPEEADFKGHLAGIFYIDDGQGNPVLLDGEIGKEFFGQLEILLRELAAGA